MSHLNYLPQSRCMPENRVAVMLEMGMDYRQIKAMLGNLKITAHAG